jgi:rifampicin phosphotransferase
MRGGDAMNHHDQRPTVAPLGGTAADLERVGGKGASLARLVRAGIAVPLGFCVTTDAYTRFVTEAGLHEPILDAVAESDPQLPESLRRAAERIAALFRDAEMPEDLAAEIRPAYQDLAAGKVAVAVRSSATAEDLPEHSFAELPRHFLPIFRNSTIF